MDRVDYVLGRFSGDEAEAAEAAANLAAAAVADWIALGMDAARNAYNGLRPAEPAGQGRGV
jgi:peptidyl-tRNA hydrolase